MEALVTGSTQISRRLGFSKGVLFVIAVAQSGSTYGDHNETENIGRLNN